MAGPYVKADMSGILTTPKVEASVCYNAGDVQLGAETTVCSSKGLTAGPEHYSTLHLNLALKEG